MRGQGKSLQQAIAFMRERHPIACPNAGFLQRLASLEQDLRGSCTVKVCKPPTLNPNPQTLKPRS